MLKKLTKIIAAGVVAFLFLNILCLFYYNMPGHISGKTGATDYIYPQYAYYSQMTEGFGYGRVNNEGYNNIDDYESQKIDILLMGSSHIEGMNVPQRETAASILNSLSKEKYAYNIGFSTHDFLRNLNNLKEASDYYVPQGYVVLEIQNTVFDIGELEAVAYSKMDRLPAFDHGLLSYLQRMPYLRLGYRQIKFFTGFHVVDMLNFLKNNSKPEEDTGVIDWDKASSLLDLIMKKTRMLCADKGIDFIIVYHPHLLIQRNGRVFADYPGEYVTKLRNACNNNNIHFIDMTDAFITEYDENYLLPHGFSNTAVGTGHLNKTGHRLIAGQILSLINKIEKDGSI
jgi:hypothetical protein